MNLFSKILKQTGWQILGKAATSVSTFIILGVVARKYGPDGTGTFTLVLTYLGLFFMLSDFGFNAHVLKAEKIEFQKLLGTRIIWSAALMMLAILMKRSRTGARSGVFALPLLRAWIFRERILTI